MATAEHTPQDAAACFTALAALAQAKLARGRAPNGSPDEAGRDARRSHTAATLMQVAGWLAQHPTPLPCTLATLGLAFGLLGANLGTTPADQARAITCRQLGALCIAADGGVPASGHQAALAQATAAWYAAVQAMDAHQGGADPRVAAMAVRWWAEGCKLEAEAKVEGFAATLQDEALRGTAYKDGKVHLTIPVAITPAMVVGWARQALARYVTGGANVGGNVQPVCSPDPEDRSRVIIGLVDWGHYRGHARNPCPGDPVRYKGQHGPGQYPCKACGVVVCAGKPHTAPPGSYEEDTGNAWPAGYMGLPAIPAGATRAWVDSRCDGWGTIGEVVGVEMRGSEWPAPKLPPSAVQGMEAAVAAAMATAHRPGLPSAAALAVWQRWECDRDEGWVFTSDELRHSALERHWREASWRPVGCTWLVVDGEVARLGKHGPGPASHQAALVRASGPPAVILAGGGLPIEPEMYRPGPPPAAARLVCDAWENCIAPGVYSSAEAMALLANMASPEAAALGWRPVGTTWLSVDYLVARLPGRYKLRVAGTPHDPGGTPMADLWYAATGQGKPPAVPFTDRAIGPIKLPDGDPKDAPQAAPDTATLVNSTFPSGTIGKRGVEPGPYHAPGNGVGTLRYSVIDGKLYYRSPGCPAEGEGVPVKAPGLVTCRSHNYIRWVFVDVAEVPTCSAEAGVQLSITGKRWW